MSQISRSLTESEKKDCIDIRDRSPDKVFLTRVRIAEGEHNKEKNFTPFDRNSAIYDFNDGIKKFEDDSYRSLGASSFKKKLEYAKEFNLIPYKNSNRWELIGSKDAKEKRNVNGRPEEVKVGKWLEYRNKKYLLVHNSVFLTFEEFEEFENQGKKPVKNNKPESQVNEQGTN